MTDSIDLHYELDGPPDAPVVVLGSSIGTSSAMWAPQVPALSRRFRVLRYDHRGHGRSPAPPGPYELADLGRDVLALLDRLGLERVAYGGLSLGGMVGMWLGVHAPERISSLVLCCTSPYVGPPDRWQERIALVQAEGTGALVDAMTARYFSPATRAAAPPMVEEFRQGLLDASDEGYAGCCSAIAGMDLREDIRSITAPTLVLCGAQDEATPVAMGLVIQEAIAGSQLVVLPASAHLATMEQPARATAAILAHLEHYQDRYDRGLAVRRAVQGDDHVLASLARTTPFDAPLQDLITAYAFGEAWDRPGLDRATRSAVTMAILTALGKTAELATHVRAARRNGLTPEQISEVLLHATIYCGVPAGHAAFAVARQVLEDDDA